MKAVIVGGGDLESDACAWRACGNFTCFMTTFNRR